MFTIFAVILASIAIWLDHIASARGVFALLVILGLYLDFIR